MGLPKSIRLDDDLEPKIHRYLKKNNLKFPQLVKLALEKFISQEQIIVLKASDDDIFEKAQKAFVNHKETMDKLK